LTEALQALQRTTDGVPGEPPLVVQAGRETHLFTQAVDDDELTMMVACHHHVEAVGSEVYGRENVRNLCRAARQIS
jgi:hypothetical protein